ncbi:hypothetical protein NUW58_g6403 [Xylaria curta]|uniref:Uncharacterized protein n=1 Tax=Xylaria curta TaxID=42375 RepID=A0ACC1NTJ6_9PEZI|nr:hypothetical protein NUW58_g6403 [Xylaria curta]
MSPFEASKRKAWKSTAWANVALVFVLEILLVSFLGISLAKPASSITTSTIIYEASCAKTQNLNIILHLIINLASTGLVASSNYFMQILSAPSREEIDKAHKKLKALDIGLPSLHNFRHLSRLKQMSWLVLLISSVPVHLFFNSSVFETTYQGSNWQLTISTESLVKGYPFFLPGSSLAAAGSWGPLCEGNRDAEGGLTTYACRYLDSDNTTWTIWDVTGFGNPVPLEEYSNTSSSFRVSIDTAVKSGSQWTRLSAEDCWAEYAQGKPRELYGDVIFIVKTDVSSIDGWARSEIFDLTSLGNLSQTWDPYVPPNVINSLWYSTQCSSSNFWYQIHKDGTSTCDALMGDNSRALIFSYPSAPFGVPLPPVQPQIFASQHQFRGLNLQYCLAQPSIAKCNVGLSNTALGIVIICGIIKLAACIVVLLKLDRHSLVTPGDVIESFISKPDLYTVGVGTLDVADVRQLSYYRPSQSIVGLSPSPRPWQHTKHRKLRSIMTTTDWVLSYLPFFAAVVVLLIALFVSYNSNGRSLQGAFGRSGQNLLVSVGQPGYIGSLLIANVPQLLLSIGYFQYNALCTRLCVEAEWNSYGSSYKPLRVSHPTGQQISSYRLQVPYRYGVPLLITSALLHWLLSNAIFIFISEGGYWTGTRGPLIGVASQLSLTDDDSLVALRHSPIAILSLLISVSAVVPLPLLVSFRKLKNNMVVGGSNSLVISAACHCYASKAFLSDRMRIEDHEDGDETASRDLEASARLNNVNLVDEQFSAIARSKVMWGAQATPSTSQATLPNYPRQQLEATLPMLQSNHHSHTIQAVEVALRCRGITYGTQPREASSFDRQVLTPTVRAFQCLFSPSASLTTVPRQIRVNYPGTPARRSAQLAKMVRYAPLDAARNEIRLLVLLPGEARDDLVCTLRTVSLDSVSDFDAISYVWGDLPAKLPIRVDGEVFFVTADLEAALRALRKPRKQRSVWVDAVCINQEDIQEKNTQVPQMGRIYSTARSVIAWLGSPNPNMELALSYMLIRAQKKLTSGSAHWLKLNTKAAFSRAAKRERDWALVRTLEGYCEIGMLPYWNRMWTFQEYVLPSKEPLCMLEGFTPFRLTALVGQAGSFLIREGERVLNRQSTTSDRARSWSEEEWAFATNVKNAARRIRKYACSRRNFIFHLLPQDARGAIKRVKTSPLLGLMTLTAERVCSDERDKAFALYGMAPSIQDIYPPDYTKSVKVVMLETTAYLVNHESGLFMYGVFNLRDNRLSDTTYPSWVPDFRQANGEGSNTHTWSPLVRQLALRLHKWENTPKARVTPDLTTLHLWARTLGECKVAFRFSTVVSEVLEQVRTLLQPKSSEFLENSLLNTIRKPETFIPRVARVCVAHEAYTKNHSVPEILEAFESIFKGLRVGSLSDKQMNCTGMIKVAANSLVGKSFLITPSGLFGIGLNSIKDGDVMDQFITKWQEQRLSMVLRGGELEDTDLIASIEVEEMKEFLIH